MLPFVTRNNHSLLVVLLSGRVLKLSAWSCYNISFIAFISSSWASFISIESLERRKKVCLVLWSNCNGYSYFCWFSFVYLCCSIAKIFDRYTGKRVLSNGSFRSAWVLMLHNQYRAPFVPLFGVMSILAPTATKENNTGVGGSQQPAYNGTLGELLRNPYRFYYLNSANKLITARKTQNITNVSVQSMFKSSKPTMSVWTTRCLVIRHK